MSDRNAVLNREWNRLVSQAFPAVSPTVRDELLAILDEYGDSVYTFYRRQVRPLPDDIPRTVTPRQRSAMPSYARILLTALLVRNRMPAYRTATVQDAQAVHASLTENGNEDLQQWLTNAVEPTESERNYLHTTTRNAEQEVHGYENELDGIDDVGPTNGGMSTNNAINCLRDFDGRTEPLLRGVLTSVETGDTVLDIGTGTGILAISAAIRGAERVVALELNPVTALLARRIVTDLVNDGLLPEETVRVCWGDAARFGTDSYTDEFRAFDTIISENISTGLFFEPQVQLIDRMYDAGLADADTTMLPRGIANYATLVTVDPNHTPIRPAETVLQLQNQGFDITATATDPVQYDYVDHMTQPQPSGVTASLEQDATTETTVNAVRLHSVIDLGEGGYIGRQENTFLNHDLLLYLTPTNTVTQGQRAHLSIAYTYGHTTNSSVIELSLDEHENVVARHAIDSDQHASNIERLRDNYGLDDSDVPLRTTESVSKQFHGP